MGGATEHALPTRRMRAAEEIAVAWLELLRRRRLVQPDDRAPIREPGTIARIWTDWMHEWLEEELRPEQQRKPPS